MWFKPKNPAKPILDKYMDSDLAIFACGKDAPTESQIKNFEKEIGFRLPEDFRIFSMSSLGGVYVEVKESLWPRPKAGDVGPFWSFLYAVYSYGFGAGIPDWMDIRIQRTKIIEEMGHDVVPCLKIMGDADYYCFDRSGTLQRWRHEGDVFEAVGMPFLQAFELEVKDLKERKEKKKSEQD